MPKYVTPFSQQFPADFQPRYAVVEAHLCKYSVAVTMATDHLTKKHELLTMATNVQKLIIMKEFLVYSIFTPIIVLKLYNTKVLLPQEGCVYNSNTKNL